MSWMLHPLIYKHLFKKIFWLLFKKPNPSTKFWLRTYQGPTFDFPFSNICPIKSFFFQKTLMTSLKVIFGLPHPGAYLGGALGHGPPFWVTRIAKLHRKLSKIKACPPLCKLGIRFDYTKDMLRAFLPGFGLVIGLKAGEDLFFFFCSSPNFGRKIWLNLNETISNSDLCSSQIFWSFWTPPFQNPACDEGFWKRGGGGQEPQKIWEEQRPESTLFHSNLVRCLLRLSSLPAFPWGLRGQ